MKTFRCRFIPLVERNYQVTADQLVLCRALLSNVYYC